MDWSTSSPRSIWHMPNPSVSVCTTGHNLILLHKLLSLNNSKIRITEVLLPSALCWVRWIRAGNKIVSRKFSENCRDMMHNWDNFKSFYGWGHWHRTLIRVPSYTACLALKLAFEPSSWTWVHSWVLYVTQHVRIELVSPRTEVRSPFQFPNEHWILPQNFISPLRGKALKQSQWNERQPLFTDYWNSGLNYQQSTERRGPGL